MALLSRHFNKANVCTPIRRYAQQARDSNSIVSGVGHFVRKEIIPKAAEYDASGEFPWDIVKQIHRLGFLNVDIPKELCGLGMDLMTKARIYQELAYGCGTIAASLMITELAQIPLVNSGSDYLKQIYLTRMLKEPLLAAYATTEHEAGSDLASATLSAVEDGDAHYNLNGTKAWVTNCGLASCESTGKAFTGFIVDRDLKGVVVGKKEAGMGLKCGDIRSLTLDNVRVPRRNVVGEIGRGFVIAMQAFDRIRPLVASLGCGIQQRALDEATRYALKRQTFGKKIIEHQNVGLKLSVIAQNLEASKLLVQQAAEKVENKDPSAAYFSAISKCFSTDAALQASIDAMKILGANGYSSEFPVEKLVRDSSALQFMSGTNDIQRNAVISRYLAKEYSKPVSCSRE